MRHGKKFIGVMLTVATQGTIQLTSLLSALIIVRLLPVEEYAYYTISTAVLGTLTVLADSGISQSILAQGGRVWKDRTALGVVVAAGLALRRKFSFLAALVSLPILGVLLNSHGAGLLTIVALSLATLGLFYFVVNGSLFEVVPRLHQNILGLQKIQIAAGLMRLVAVMIMMLSLPMAWAANVAAAMAVAWSAWRVRILAATLALWKQPVSPVVRKEMNTYVRRTLPGAIYFAFAGQITIWLISIFGDTASVAQVGALGRLAMVFNVFTSVFALLMVPRFARMESPTSNLLLRRFWQAQLPLLLVLMASVAFVIVFPQIALAILGPNYAALTSEIVLMAVGSALSVMAGAAYTLAAARSVVVNPLFSILFFVIVQCVLIVWLPIHKVEGVLWLGIIINLVYWCMHAGYFSWVQLKSK